MMFYTRVSCDPPLGQPTVIPRGQNEVHFTVLLETNEDSSASDWEVHLWHNCHGHQEWNATGLRSAILHEQQSLLVIRQNGSTYKKNFFFTTSLKIPSPGNSKSEFTIRYRRNNRDWIWVNAQSSISNGELIFQLSSLPDGLSTSFSKFTTTADIKYVQSQVSDTRLWSLEFETPAAGKQSAVSSSLLGVPLYVARWWALVRQWAAWLQPAHGHGVFEVQQDAVICSFLCRDGLHVVLLAISGVDDVQTVFRDDAFGGVLVVARNEREEASKARILVSIGYTHETALAAAIYAARNLVQNGSYSATNITDSAPKSNDVEIQWHSSWSDGLGYCTWNALGQKLTEDKICNALQTLRENNINIETLIIDDNWQTLDQSNPDPHYHTWSDFEANPEGFPRGLQATISDIRKQNRSIKHIAVWHAMFGYWGGIDPNGTIAQNYETKQINRMDTGRKGFEAAKLTVITADDVQRFYKDFYDFLANCGINAVKTDAQMMLDLVADPEDRRTIIRAYQDAWNLNGLVYFGDKLISCMSHTPANIFHSLLPKARPAITLRNSDDFWPEIPESHPWHIFTNANNSLLTQHLNVVPDWDMFQTTHEFAAFHAAARCISGSPIYITDEPGKHNVDLIKQMTAETVRGVTIVLRPSSVARAVSSSVYISNNEPRLLKVGAYHGHAQTGAGILCAFNCGKESLVDFVHLQDFRGVIADQKYVVYSYTTGKTSVLSLDAEINVISIELPVRGWEILTSRPISSFTKDEKTIDIAPLGLVDKMSGAAAFSEYTIIEKDQSLQLTIPLKALGVLGIYVSGLDQMTIEDNFMVVIHDRVIPIELISANSNVLNIDVLAAWKALDEDEDDGWTNEITIDIVIIW